MLSKLKARNKVFEFVQYDEMEFSRDGFLIIGEDLNLIEEKWIDWIDQDDSEHPNNYFDYINCYFDSQTENDLNINLLLDRSFRFHSIKKIIPKSKIHCSFIPYSMEGHQYTIVDKDWFNFIRNSLYSTYALIDFVGIREIISKHSEIPQTIIESLKIIIDEFAVKNPSYDFLTCADNIIVKSNWLINEQINTYSPESFVTTIHKLMEQLKNEIDLSSYAIITQGANYVNEIDIREKDRQVNHFFMPSISVPFIEAFEIDNDARKRIRNKEINKCQFYIEYSFYISLKRKFYSNEEPSWVKYVEFTNSKNNNKIKYIGLNYLQINELVNL